MKKLMIKVLFVMFTAFAVNSANAEPMPKKFDVKGYYDSVNFQQRWVSINTTRKNISLDLKAYNSDGSDASLIGIKPDTPVGATYKAGSSKKEIDKIWILPDDTGLTPPG
jgi:hypothetical protein